MRKEIFFAIITGSLFGLIIAFGVFRANRALSLKSEVANGDLASPTPSSGNLTITLAAPEEGDVVTRDTVLVSGITRPKSYVVFSGEEVDYVRSTDHTGAFEQEVDLISGVNNLTVNVFDSDGNFSDLNVILVYSSEFGTILDEMQNPPEEDSEASPSDSVREAVEQKVQDSLNSPKAYLGTITDISESTLQIKADLGEIQQVSVDEEKSTIVNVGKTNKEIKFADLAIGDYIIAMGFKNGNNILEAKRVLVTTAPEEQKRRAVFGEVKTIDTDEETMTISQADNDVNVVLVKSVEISKLEDEETNSIDFSDIEEKNLIIAVGSETDGEFEARSIFVVPKI